MTEWHTARCFMCGAKVSMRGPVEGLRAIGWEVTDTRTTPGGIIIPRRVECPVCVNEPTAEEHP